MLHRVNNWIRLNADKPQSITSALDFFGDSLEQDNVTPTPDNLMEAVNSKLKGNKLLKRKRDKGKDAEEAIKGKDAEEAIKVKRLKLKSSSKTLCLTAYDNIRDLLYQVMRTKIANCNKISVIQMMMVMKLLLCYQGMPLWMPVVVSDTKQRVKS